MNAKASQEDIDATLEFLNWVITSDEGRDFQAFLSGALLTAVPGILAQLVLIPLILTALEKAGFMD